MENQTFREGDLVGVSLKEKNVVREGFGRCLGVVPSHPTAILVDVFGVGLRTIDSANPYFPLMSKERGAALQPRTPEYERAPVRRVCKPRFVIERNQEKRTFHLVAWSFAMGQNSMWVPDDRVATLTLDTFMVLATGRLGLSQFNLGPWTAFVVERVPAKVEDGSDPFEH